MGKKEQVPAAANLPGTRLIWARGVSRSRVCSSRQQTAGFDGRHTRPRPTCHDGRLAGASHINNTGLGFYLGIVGLSCTVFVMTPPR